MTKTYSDFFNNQVILDHLPFNLDFEIQPETQGKKVVVGGLTLCLIDELLVRESWFLETLESIDNSNKRELTDLYLAIMTALKDELNLTSIDEAQEVFSSIDHEIRKERKEEYEIFFEKNLKQINEMTALTRLAQSPLVMKWMRVTMFILSRSTLDWSLGKTAQLRESTLNEIDTLIIKEANKGQDPLPVEEVGEGKKTKATTAK